MASSCLYLLGFAIALLLNGSLAAIPSTAGCTFSSVPGQTETGSIQLFQQTSTDPVQATVFINGGTAGATYNVQTETGVALGTCTGGALGNTLLALDPLVLDASGNLAKSAASSVITLVSPPAVGVTYVTGQTYVVYEGPVAAGVVVGCCTIAATNDFVNSLSPPALNTGTYLLIALASVLVGSIILICIFLVLCVRGRRYYDD